MNFSVHAFDFILISSSFYLILPNSSVTRRALLSDLIPCKYVSEVDGFYLIRCHLFCRVRFVYDHCDTVCRNDCSFQFLFFFIFYCLLIYTFFFPLITSRIGFFLSIAKASSSASADAMLSCVIFAYCLMVRCSCVSK